MTEQNKMKEIRIEKVTLNIGAGKEQTVVEKGLKLLSSLTGVKAVKTLSKKRIPGWGIRVGLPIGCKTTIRNGADKLITRTLSAVDNTLSEGNFDDFGNVSFGVPEYIDISDAKYEPEIGMMGLQVCITLERRGFRVSKRKISKRKVGKKHKITKEEAIGFMKTKFNLKLKEEEK